MCPQSDDGDASDSGARRMMMTMVMMDSGVCDAPKETGVVDRNDDVVSKRNVEPEGDAGVGCCKQGDGLGDDTSACRHTFRKNNFNGSLLKTRDDEEYDVEQSTTSTSNNNDANNCEVRWRGGQAGESEPHEIASGARTQDELLRIQLLRSLNISDTEDERFSSIARLVCSVLHCPMAAVLLVDKERQWFHSAEGMGDTKDGSADASTRRDTCVLPHVDEVMIVRDTKADMGFFANPVVTGPPYIRFYAGVPLVSSVSGARYGTLCAVDTKPHHDVIYDMHNMLPQFAELVVREIEKDKLALLRQFMYDQKLVCTSTESSTLESVRTSSASDVLHIQTSVGLQKAADCFGEGVMLVGVSGSWRVSYCNSALADVLSIETSKMLNKGFWEFFFCDSGERKEAHECVESNIPFTLVVQLQNVHCPEPRNITVDFRPATTQVGNVGVPQMPASDESHHKEISKYYFAIVRPESARIGGKSFGATGREENELDDAPRLSKVVPTAFRDVRLGPLIGRGAYGRVYRGTWNGNVVAVKVITSTDPQLGSDATASGEGSKRRKAVVFEAALSASLSHPNVVHTYQYAVRRIKAPPKPSEPDGPQRTLFEVWLIADFCNRGPLLTAIERGIFLTQSSTHFGQPNLIAVLQTLQEIAAAMEYLHSHHVVHGDLTGGNVLLTSSDKDARGFTAKVVDFGLSRVCKEDGLQTKTMGCAEYMPPELITGGLLTRACDVYAYGVILWELYCGRRAWAGLKASQVLEKVAADEALIFPSQTPRRLKLLGEKCLSKDPQQRPKFKEILAEVNAILSDTMNILHQFLNATGSQKGE